MINKSNYRSFIHPVLFSIFPILFIYSQNLVEVQAGQLVFPLLFSSTAAALSVSILIIFKRSSEISAAAVSYIVIAFFSYGHLQEIILQISMGFILRKFFIFYTAITLTLFALIAFLLHKYTEIIRAVEDVLNKISLILVILPLVLIIHFHITTDLKKQVIDKTEPKMSIESQKYYPDIYYIILDGYAASRTLLSQYSYDNSEFTGYLKSQGFHIIENSFSNYAHTYLSLASSLNMRYLDHKNKYKSRGKFQKEMFNLLTFNKVVRELKTKGYTYIHIGAGIGMSNQNHLADISIDPGTLGEFSIMLFKTTPLFPFIKETILFQQARNRILNTFETIPQFAEKRGPKFIFAHIMSPHPPYLFGIDGGAPEGNLEFKFKGSVWDHKEDYIKQLIYINSLIKDLVTTIKSKSAKDPVIILQADHGSGAVDQIFRDKSLTELLDEKLKQRFYILNAWYLPKEIEKPTHIISPVNSFRFLFNKLFNYNLKLYDNKAWFSTSGKPYYFKEITGQINKQ